MLTYVIVNRNAGTAAQATVLQDVIAANSDITLCETKGSEHTTVLAAEAVQAGCERIIAVGGDGTIHGVLNGLAADFPRVTLGIIPLGTGNDLARTLGLPMEPLEAWHVATTGEARWLDVIKVETAGQPAVYGLNMAVGGFTGQMNEVLTSELKKSWGPLAYLIGSTQVLPDLTSYKTILTCDDGPVEHLQALNVAVANGRTAGGGYGMAPTANPEDGWLDLVVVCSGSLVELAEVAARFVAGTVLDSALVVHRRVRRLRLFSRPGMWFNVDGELLTNEPLTFTILPQALRVVVGPDYTPDP